MHETVFENVLGNDRSPIRLGGKRHVLRLHIGRKTRIFFGDDISCPRRASDDPDGVRAVSSFHPGFFEFLQQRHKMTGIASRDIEIAASQRARNDEGASLNAVRNDAVLGAM